MTKSFLIVAIGFAIGAGSSIYKYRNPGNGHIQTRENAVLSLARQDTYPVVLMGDSIVELADLPALCGGRALNAGLAGGTVSDVEAYAPRLLQAVRPKLIILAIGTNDAHVANQTAPEAFAASYKRLIGIAQHTGAKIVLVNVEPVASGRFEKSAIFDQARIRAENAQIASFGLPVIDLADAMTAKNRFVLPDGYTDDGVHPNPAGYVRWKQTVSTACQYLRT